jgi:hypothetical protein
VARERKTIKVIIPDASPLLTLGRIGRLDVFRHFVVAIQIVDIVKEEAMRPINDVTGNVRKWFDALPNNIEIVDTTVGLGLKARRSGERILRPVNWARSLSTSMRQSWRDKVIRP